MEKTNIKAYLAENYNSLAYTHNYVFGYVSSGMVYGAIVENAKGLIYPLSKLDKASQKNGGTYQLKYKPDKVQLALLQEKASKIVAICTLDYLEKVNAESRHNRGQIFEYLTAKTLKGEQVTKANAKFTESGDIVVSGKHYQVKYLKATFTDERTIQHFTKR